MEHAQVVVALVQRDLSESKIIKQIKDKGTAIPVEACACPEGSRRLRLPDFETVGTRRW